MTPLQQAAQFLLIVLTTTAGRFALKGLIRAARCMQPVKRPDNGIPF